MRRLHALMVVALVLIVCVEGAAGVGFTHVRSFPSKRTVSLLDDLRRSRIGLPTELRSAGDVYVMISAGASFYGVTVLGQPSVPPVKFSRALSALLRDGVLDGTVGVSGRGNGYSASSILVRRWRFGASEGSMAVPVGAVLAGLRRRGLVPHAVVSVRRYAQPGPLRFPSMAREASIAYNVSNSAPDLVVRTHGKITARLKLLAWGVLALPVCLSGLLLVWAMRLWRRVGVDRALRRGRFTALMAGATIGAMWAPIFAFALVIRSNAARPIYDIWFGGDFSRGILAVLCCGAVLCALSAVAFWLLRRRLHGGERESSEDHTELMPAMPWWYMAALVCFQWIWKWLVHTLGALPLLPRVPVALLCVVLIRATAVVGWNRWADRRAQLCRVDDTLTARAKALADRMGVHIEDVRIDASIDGRKHTQGRVIRSDHIVLAQSDLDHLSPAELDWLIAHELAHLTHRDASPLGGPGSIGVIAFVTGALVVMSEARGVLQLCLAVGVIMAMLAAAIVYTMRVSRRREIAADSAALRCTRDLDSAESALAAMARYSAHPKQQEKDTTHPKLSTRLANLEVVAAELGIERRATEASSNVRSGGMDDAER